MRFQRKRGFYERYVKRLLDILCALMAFLVFGWLFILVAVLVRINLGTPVIFQQPRPGFIKNGKEQIFTLYKFRTMTDERDENGKLLPDDRRLTKFGKMLRATSLDELPEAINILRGDMSVVGPRPQLVRDMVFITDEQHLRHTARPGLSGLAQVMGRNAICWNEKLNWDLKYIDRISFCGDLKIVLLTIKQVFFQKGRTDSSEEIDLTLDYGDALLKAGKVSKSQYDMLQKQARNLIQEYKESVRCYEE